MNAKPLGSVLQFFWVRPGSRSPSALCGKNAATDQKQRYYLMPHSPAHRPHRPRLGLFALGTSAAPGELFP